MPGVQIQKDPNQIEGKEPPKYRTFAVVLQPREEKQMRILQHMIRFPKIYRAVYILHDKDTYDEIDLDQYKADHDGETPNWEVGDLKPPHYHVCFKSDSPMSGSAMSKRLGGIHVECVNDEKAYGLYMLHESPACWERPSKVPYDPELLQGDSVRIARFQSQNAHFV